MSNEGKLREADDRVNIIVDNIDNVDYINVSEPQQTENNQVLSPSNDIHDKSIDNSDDPTWKKETESIVSEQDIKHLSNRLFKHFSETLSINNIEDSNKEEMLINNSENDQFSQLSSSLETRSEIDRNSKSYGADKYSSVRTIPFEAMEAGAAMRRMDLVRLSSKKMDKTFISAIARMLGNLEASELVVSQKEIESTLSQLTGGTLRQKVTLLFKFMDISGDGKVSEEEANSFFKKTDASKLLERLSLLSTGHYNGEFSLNLENMITCFERSKKGKAAITIFCNQVIKILKDLLAITDKEEAVNNEHKVEKQNTGMFDVTTENLRRLSKSQRFKIAIILINVALWLWYFDGPTYEGYPVQFRVAKGFGLSLRFLTWFMFLTMARTTIGSLYNFKIFQPFLALQYKIEIHSFCGVLLFLNSLGHIAGHLAFESMHIEGGIGGAFQSSMAKYGHGNIICGWILFAMLLTMMFTALKRGDSSKWYYIFHAAHFLYIGWIVVIILHVINLWPYFVAIGGLILFERCYDFFRGTTVATLELSRSTYSIILYFVVIN